MRFSPSPPAVHPQAGGYSGSNGYARRHGPAAGLSGGVQFWAGAGLVACAFAVTILLRARPRWAALSRAPLVFRAGSSGRIRSSRG